VYINEKHERLLASSIRLASGYTPPVPTARVVANEAASSRQERRHVLVTGSQKLLFGSRVSDLQLQHLRPATSTDMDYVDQMKQSTPTKYEVDIGDDTLLRFFRVGPPQSLSESTQFWSNKP
jgi:hypothetical protein